MRILIITYGTRGDVQPYIAVGKALRRAGHHVMVATSDRFRGFVESHGLAYGYMNDRLLAILDTDQGRDLLENTTGLFGVIRQSIKMSKTVRPIQASLLREIWEVAREFQPDFIVFHPKAFSGPHIAEKLGIGAVLATPIPMLVPTSEFAFPIFPDFRLGGWYRRLSFKVIDLLTRMVLAGHVRRFREDLGLPRLGRYRQLEMRGGEPIPVLNAHSEAVLPRPVDWPETAHVTGYWFLDEEDDWQPSSQLVDFLAAGPPPVYVGFGSMAGKNPKRLAAAVVEGLGRARVRGIIATGWGGLKAEELPESILCIDKAPHAWLFPRMAAVVHHGGAGTTAAGLRAGVPSVVVPFFGDQPFWGRRVYELGAGPRPIPQKKLTGDKLASAIHEATSSRSIRRNAEMLGKAIRAENGTTAAVSLIDRYMRKG